MSNVERPGNFTTVEAWGSLGPSSIVGVDYDRLWLVNAGIERVAQLLKIGGPFDINNFRDQLVGVTDVDWLNRLAVSAGLLKAGSGDPHSN